MKCIIAGSRTIADYATVEKAIKDSKYDITEVVSGTARGVDKLGELWAENNNIPIKRFPANWDVYGNAAGPIRNRQMAEYADCAVVVWDGSSRGSKHMINIMEKIGKPYFLLKV
jgi:hypothetical protein